MSDIGKSYRIRTNVGEDSYVNVNLEQDYDTFEILSIKMSQEDTYRLHNANYGVIVGRVLANENFGVPNAKISVFIEGDMNDDQKVSSLYPYQNISSTDSEGRRYNLLPDNKVDDCHQVVGTFPNKTYLLDNDDLIEVFDKYYRYTTRTNNSGDYIICGVPTGTQTLHMDLDLSDCGILSQRPRDFVYKGYTIEQFENANQFKTGTDYESLSQIFTQNQVVEVIPFWGNESEGQSIGITRADIKIAFKFEPTCVFMGSVVGDNASNGVSKKCIPTNNMGAMDELTTGEGTIEMIRKTPDGSVEEFQVKGTQLINSNGVWCYQIPMNLDYLMTDEYGNMVPTDDPSKGIPTRARVRFRISMQDNEQNTDNYFRAKVLVPHNPQNLYSNGKLTGHEDYDYEFGTYTKDESFRDLFWNNVYTVKSYIPRFQKSKSWRNEKFSAIKHCNIYGNNNPMPYNNIRIKLPLMFTILCALINAYIGIISFVNYIIKLFGDALADIGRIKLLGWYPFGGLLNYAKTLKLVSLMDGLCPDLEGWYFSPIAFNNFNYQPKGTDYNLLKQTFDGLTDQNGQVLDRTSVNYVNSETNSGKDESVCLTVYVDYLISCVEMNLAQEYKVINFDFYNDWVNGVVYMPRWMRFLRAKQTYLFGLIKIRPKIKACMDDSQMFGQTRYYTQQCALSYKKSSKLYTNISNKPGCGGASNNSKVQNCHKNRGKLAYSIFGGNGGVVHEQTTHLDQFVYYFKPCEWNNRSGKNVKTILFANDIVLLGSLNEFNQYGIPQAFKYLRSSTYVMPTNLAQTNMDDEGYLYADDRGTICNGESTENNINYVANGVSDKKIGIVESTFTATQKYHRGEIEYGKTEGGDNYDDTIPLTESAGISWNYTGPGQGSASTNPNVSLYYPGGHFLGLSCFNSQTNIKSCVNLQRICEAGANMSQRREEVRSLNNADGITTVLYSYFVPTGLVSQDDINGTNFRSMFATMNYKRLLCENRFDENTGYPIYDFMYLRPGGFDGALAKSVNKASQYNMMIDVVDETNAMAKSGVTKSDSYDPNEKRNTMTRTIEEQSQDYYMFRLGLQTLEDEEQKSKFLYFDTTNGASLPQYENSFYFYFGLKDGSTALDEFNKQFFSQCESSSIIMNTPTINVSTEFDCCNFTMDVDIAVENMQAPVTLTLRTGEAFDQVYGNINEVTLTGTNIYTISLSGIPAGKYEIVVTDGGGEQLTKQVDFMPEDFTVDYETYPFEFRVANNSIENVINSGRTTDSGYIQINGKSVPSCAEEYGNDYYVVVRDNEYYAIEDNQVGIRLDGVKLESYSDGKFYAWCVDTQLEIGIVGRCKNGNWQYIKISTTTIRGIDSFDLYLGSKMLPYSTKLSSLTGDWWNNIGSDSLQHWAMRHALFRQIDDDTEMFDNQVLALDVNNSVVGTVLFGAAESGKNASTVVHYADDMSYTDIGGELSDSSLISTWPRSKFTKPCYGEMAMDNNGSVVSECICTTTANIGNGGSANQYVIGDFPTETVNNLTGSNKLRENHGCIVKFDDGTIVYPIWDGNNFTYYGDQPEETDNVNIRIYPIFYYPVMYRPFYGNVNFLTWTNGRIMSEVGESATDIEIQYDMDCCRIEAEIFNGITYNGRRFGTSMFLDSGVTLTRQNGQTDLDTSGEGNNAVLKYYKNVLNTNTENPIQITEFNYSVTEGAPNNSTIKENELDKPYEIELAVTEGSVSNNFPTEITYQDNGFSYTMGYNGGSITDTKFYLSRKGISLNDLDGKGNGFEQGGTMFIPLDVKPGDEGRKTFETNNYICHKGFGICNTSLDVYWVGNCGYVYGKFNNNIKKWSSKNIPGQATMVKLYKGELESWLRPCGAWGKCLRPTVDERLYPIPDLATNRYVFVISAYNGEEATEITENLIQDLYLDDRNFVGYTMDGRPTQIESMKTGYQVLNGLGKKENEWVIDKLSEAGVDLFFTYSLETTDNAEICKSIIGNLKDANKFVEFTPGKTIGDSQLNGGIDGDTFAIAVSSASTSSNGIITAIKVYPKLKSLGYEDDYDTVGILATPDEFSGITWEGETLQITVDSNIDWYTQFIDEDGNYVESPEWISIIVGGTKMGAITSSGDRIVDILVEETEDYDNERSISLEFCSVMESTNPDTGEMGPTYTFPVTFHQEARPRLQYIEPVTSTIFSNGGGNLSINVISNRLEREGGWTLTINHETGTEGWLTFDNGETTLTGFGNTTVSLLANANESATENKSRVCISDASEGNECIEFMQGGGSVQFSVYPPELTFESSGGTNYISVVSTAEYSVKSTPRWIECEDDGGGSITVICEEYDGDNDRSGTIEISSGDITKEIKVNQKANKA